MALSGRSHTSEIDRQALPSDRPVPWTFGGPFRHVRGMLADLKMPGSLEAIDGILSEIDGGRVADVRVELDQVAGMKVLADSVFIERFRELFQEYVEERRRETDGPVEKS